MMPEYQTNSSTIHITDKVVNNLFQVSQASSGVFPTVGAAQTHYS